MQEPYQKGHKINWDNPTILVRHPYFFQRCISESWHICSQRYCSDRVGESGKGKEKPRGEREGKELQLWKG